MELPNRSISRFVQSLKDKVDGYGKISSTQIYDILRKRNVLYYNEEKRNLPHQKFIDAGYFTLTIAEGVDKGNNPYKSLVTLITPKGEEWLLQKLIEAKYISMKVQ